jgi:hypothetical protein
MTNPAASTTTPVASPVTNPTSTPANTKPDPTMDAMHEVTVNGKKVKVSLKDALANYQVKSAADEKFREASAKTEQVEQALARIKDPAQLETVLEELGANADEIAEALYAQRQARKKALDDDAKLTPEQRELKELRALKAEQDALKKETEDKKKAREDEVKYNTTVTIVSTSIKTALKEFGLPETPANIGWVARALQELKKSDEGIVQGKVNLGKLLEKMKTRGKDHFEFSTQGYDPGRILDMIPEDKREALLVEYLKQKGSKKAKGKEEKADLSGNSPAEHQIRGKMKFIV